MRVLAEIRPRSEDGARIGALRRSDLVAFSGLVEKLDGSRAVLLTGSEAAVAPTAVGLAAVAVSRGTRAALLECDLESPTLARGLGIDERPGLREYLAGQAEASELLQPLVLAGPHSAGAREPLVCVVAGEAVGDAAPWLSSERFRQAVAGLLASYELVVIAGPPLERGFDGLRELAHLVDATVACMPRSELSGAVRRRLRRTLRGLPGRFRGFVAVG